MLIGCRMLKFDILTKMGGGLGGGGAVTQRCVIVYVIIMCHTVSCLFTSQFNIVYTYFHAYIHLRSKHNVVGTHLMSV